MYHHGDLYNALVTEASTLARAGGAEAVSLRKAARRVGVSHAAAYRHFRDRRALLAAAATRAMSELAARLEGAAGEVSEPRARARAIGRAYVAWALEEPGSFRLAFWKELADKTPFPALREASDRASAPVLEAVREWLGPGSGAWAVRTLAVQVWVQAHGTAELLLAGQLAQGELSVPDRAAALESLDVAVSAILDAARGGRAG